jgi:hypothetical protein
MLLGVSRIANIGMAYVLSCFAGFLNSWHRLLIAEVNMSVLINR